MWPKWLQQIFDAFSQLPWLVQMASLALLLALLVALYILFRFRKGTEQTDAWPYRVFRWLQSHSLSLAVIAVLVFLFGGIVLIGRQWWISGEIIPSQPIETGTTLPESSPSATATPGITVADTPTPVFSIILADASGKPLPGLNDAPMQIEQPEDTRTPTPVYPYFLLNEPSIDYYVLPDSLPVRYDLPTALATKEFEIKGISHFFTANSALWYQICCVRGTAVWIDGLGRVVENSVALKYVPTIAFPTPTLQFTPTPTPTAPYLKLVESASLINLYTGPSESFPLAAQLGSGVQLEVNGKTADGAWYRVCCFDMGVQTGDNTLWVRNEPSIIRVFNELALNVWATPVLSPPTPISVYFSRAQGPEVLGIDNNFLTIYVKVVGDPPGYTRALPGYFLAVEFKPTGQNAFSKREASNRGPDNVLLTSTDYFSSDLGGIQYNYKFEYMPNGDLLDGDWRFWLTNAQREQMSELVTFTSKPKERGVYVVWHQIR